VHPIRTKILRALCLPGRSFSEAWRLGGSIFFLLKMKFHTSGCRWLKGSQSGQKKKLKAFTAEFAENAEKAHFKSSLRSSAVSAVKKYSVVSYAEKEGATGTKSVNRQG